MSSNTNTQTSGAGNGSTMFTVKPLRPRRLNGAAKYSVIRKIDRQYEPIKAAIAKSVADGIAYREAKAAEREAKVAAAKKAEANKQAHRYVKNAFSLKGKKSLDGGPTIEDIDSLRSAGVSAAVCDRLVRLYVAKPEPVKKPTMSAHEISQRKLAAAKKNGVGPDGKPLTRKQAGRRSKSKSSLKS